MLKDKIVEFIHNKIIMYIYQLFFNSNWLRYNNNDTKNLMKKFIEETKIEINENDNILDIGCGNASIL